MLAAGKMVTRGSWSSEASVPEIEEPQKLGDVAKMIVVCDGRTCMSHYIRRKLGKRIRGNPDKEAIEPRLVKKREKQLHSTRAISFLQRVVVKTLIITRVAIGGTISKSLLLFGFGVAFSSPHEPFPAQRTQKAVCD